MDIDALIAALDEYQDERAQYQAYRDSNPYPHPYARERLDKTRERAGEVLATIIDARIEAHLQKLLTRLT